MTRFTVKIFGISMISTKQSLNATETSEITSKYWKCTDSLNLAKIHSISTTNTQILVKETGITKSVNVCFIDLDASGNDTCSSVCFNFDDEFDGTHIYLTYSETSYKNDIELLTSPETRPLDQHMLSLAKEFLEHSPNETDPRT